MALSTSPSTVRLVPARPKDIEQLMPFVRQFYYHFNYPFDESRKQSVLNYLLHYSSLGRMMAIEQDGHYIGYVLLAFSFSLEFNGQIAFIDELFIEPASRQKGAGSQVLALVEDLCVSLGIKAVRLESAADNQRATALYARSGYHDHQRHLMTKILNRDKGY